MENLVRDKVGYQTVKNGREGDNIVRERWREIMKKYLGGGDWG